MAKLYFLLLIVGACHGLPDEVIDDIQAQKANVDRILSLVQEGAFKHKAYNLLANFTDAFGPRVSGSQVLEDAIDHVINFFISNGISAHGEDVQAPDWIRGIETGAILTPRASDLPIMSLGSSISTEGKITADVLVVRSFEELDERQDEVPGKIVVFNQEWDGYTATVPYRHGAVQASKYEAVASLTKSVADFSLYTLHTGQTNYNESIAPKIPTACITVEDAELLQRYQDAGAQITIEIEIETENRPDMTSRNVVAEIEGSEHPEEVVLFGGHIDSWDVGTGAMDDGGGCMISVMVLLIMKELNIIPRRTMRCVLWTAEEEGLIGAHQYYADHQDDKENFVWMIESDGGIFQPSGIRFDGSGLAKAYMEEIMMLLESIGMTGVEDGAHHPDLGMWDAEIPKGSLDIDRSTYFWYHHTHADTMEVMDPDIMDLATSIWAASTYTVANMEHRLPWEGEYPLDKLSGATLPQSMNHIVMIMVVLVSAMINLK